MKDKIREIKDQMDVWAKANVVSIYPDITATIEMGQLLSMIVGYISSVEDKIDNQQKEEQ